MCWRCYRRWSGSRHTRYGLGGVTARANIAPANTVPANVERGNIDFDGLPFGEHREEARPTLLAAFANTQFFGDGMRIAPQADASDGQLDICRIGKMNAIELAGMFPTVYFGRHLGSPRVEYWKDKRVRVESDVPLEIYADGEFVCETPAEISVAPGALRVIAG